MEKTTKYFTYCYENDTTVEYVKAENYSMLNCSFTSEDKDYGTDTLHWTGCGVVPMDQLAYEMKHALSEYLDKEDRGLYEDIDSIERMMFGDFSNSTLIAVEYALEEISKNYNPKKWYATIREASERISKALLKDRTKTFAFCESDREEAKGNPEDHVDEGGWHGIKRIDGFFDNEPGEFIVAVGHYGGGNVAFGYVDEYEADDYACEHAVCKAICDATCWDSDNMIYIEED